MAGSRRRAPGRLRGQTDPRPAPETRPGGSGSRGRTWPGPGGTDRRRDQDSSGDGPPPRPRTDNQRWRPAALEWTPFITSSFSRCSSGTPSRSEANAVSSAAAMSSPLRKADSATDDPAAQRSVGFVEHVQRIVEEAVVGQGQRRSGAARRTGAGNGEPDRGRNRVGASTAAAHRRRAASPPRRRRRTARRSTCRAAPDGAWRDRASPPTTSDRSGSPGSPRDPRARGSARREWDRAGRRASRAGGRRPGRPSRPAGSGRPGGGLPSRGRRWWRRERPGPRRRPLRRGRGGCG